MAASRSTLAFCLFTCCAALPLEAQIRPAAPPAKPERYRVPAGWERDLVNVKFRDGLRIRLRDGELTDFGTGALDAAKDALARLRSGTWSRTHTLEEAQLDEMRFAGERRVGFALHDLNLHFRCRVPADVDLAAAIDALNALACVEWAEAVPGLAPLPQVEDYREKQGYQEPGPRGIGSGTARSFPDVAGFGNLGSTGDRARVAWIEYGFDPTHVDLPPVTMLTWGGYSTPAFDQHGTAVLGELAAKDDGDGVTGIVPSADLFFAHARTAPTIGSPYGDYLVDASIQQAAWAVGYGGVVIIEQQIAGPRWNGNPASQVGLLPVEWHLPTWQSMRNAVAFGASVVEAAGNGSQNLDDPIYDSDPFATHRPFRLANDSGALMVGAGAAPQGSGVERSRLAFSNYGATLDLQGWGEKVATTGYGDLYGAGGSPQWYTEIFSGTSSATPIVGGACALVQSLHAEQRGFAYLSPHDLRAVLRRTGSPQAGANLLVENIGPLPNVVQAALELLLHPQGKIGEGFEGSLPGFGGSGIDLMTNGIIHALAVFDADGPGAEPAYLYAGGSFSRIGRMEASNIARWTGVGWARLGTRTAQGTNGVVRALQVHQGQLFVGGEFTAAGGVARSGIARWTGVAWQSVGSGVGGAMPWVQSLCSFDADGPGGQAATLIAGGDFSQAGTTAAMRVARWNGIAWSALGDGFGDRVTALCSYDADDAGVALPQLIAGGSFKFSGLGTPLRTLAVLSGTQWLEFSGGTSGFSDTIYALESVAIPLAGQQLLFVGGQFGDLGGNWVSSPGFGVWTGSVWMNPPAYIPEPRAICAIDDCQQGLPYCGPNVYLAGSQAGSQLFRIDPTTWSVSPLESLGTPPLAAELFDEDGTGVMPPSLFLGGNAFVAGPVSSLGIAKWTIGAAPITAGSYFWQPTSCGWPFEPSIGVPLPPVMGRMFRVNFELASTASPLVLLGLPSPWFLPLCSSQGPCALGVYPILASFATRQLTLRIPCDALLVGARLAFQGFELNGVDAPGACGAPLLPLRLRTTDTLVVML